MYLVGLSGAFLSDRKTLAVSSGRNRRKNSSLKFATPEIITHVALPYIGQKYNRFRMDTIQKKQNGAAQSEAKRSVRVRAFALRVGAVRPNVTTSALWVWRLGNVK